MVPRRKKSATADLTSAGKKKNSDEITTNFVSSPVWEVGAEFGLEIAVELLAEAGFALVDPTGISLCIRIGRMIWKGYKKSKSSAPMQ